MTFIKFLFVLLLLVPIAAFMIYYINKLAVEFADSVKKSSSKKETHDKAENFNRSRDRMQQSYDSRHAKHHEIGEQAKPPRQSNTGSKRKRRKERKIKKKDREQ